LEKVLNIAKMYIKYLKSMKIPNSAIYYQILFLTADDVFVDLFCIVLHEYNFEKMKISFFI